MNQKNLHIRFRAATVHQQACTSFRHLAPDYI
jgi:hypothetical protein